jgi:predicted DNA-binding transcriptional regulator YafY
MSQRQQLERIMEIDRAIRAGEYPNADKLAEKLETSRRVIFMDREFMINRLGAPIEFSREKGGWSYSDATWTIPNIMVSEGELLAFFLSVEVARRYMGTALEEALRRAVSKFSKNIRGPVSVDLETLRKNYTFATPALAGVDEQVLLDLHHAIGERRRVWMRYYTASRDEHTERKVSPYHLYNGQGDWYLIAFDDLRKEVRNFAVGRVEELRVLNEAFKPEAEFSVEKYMQSAFQTERGGEVEEVWVRFDAQQARYMRERRWHASQRIEELPDGGVILQFRTGGLGEVKRWVMQYGGHAEVLRPEALRQAVKEEVAEMASLYHSVDKGINKKSSAEGSN